MSSGSGHPIRFGVFEVDLESGELRKHGLRIKLRDQPLQILLMLLERPGQVVSREELQRKLWAADTFVDFDRGLNKAVNHLRDALSDSAESPRFIETLPKRGYRFIAPVEASPPNGHPLEPPLETQSVLAEQPERWTHAQLPGGHGATRGLRPKLSARLPWMIAGLASVVGAISGGLFWRATRPVDRPLTRFSVDLGPDALPGFNLTVAISPDGRRLVFPARGPDGKQRLATRLLDRVQATLLPATENGSYPFFSPDGQWIGFAAGGALKKISVEGGAPVTLGMAVSATSGASWGKDGNIIAALGIVVPLSQVRAAGGPAQPLTRLGSGEITHRWPQVLPGGDAVLFTASASAALEENASIEAISLRSGQVKILQRGGYYGRYLPSGYLAYVRQGVLFGVRFDPARLEVRGAPVPLVDDVAANPITGGGQFDFSSTGAFLYAAGKSAAQPWQLAWLDSTGKTQPLLAALGAYLYPRLSPDGRKLAFTGDGQDVYVHDLERDTTTRLTFIGNANAPVWTPDGNHIVFFSVSNGYSIYCVRSDGAGDPQRVLESQGVLIPWSLSPDGRQLAYAESNPETGYDIWTLPLDITDPDHPKPGKLEPFLRTRADEVDPRFSPDGRWIAYRSNESGRDELYVRPFPAGSGGKWQISDGGGLYAFWANNGRELYYETADNRIMVVDYTVDGPSFVRGTPRLWSDKQLFYTGTVNLDLAPDGKRFVVLTLPETPAGSEKGTVHVTVLENFFDEVRRRIPPGGK